MVLNGNGCVEIDSDRSDTTHESAFEVPLPRGRVGEECCVYRCFASLEAGNPILERALVHALSIFHTDIHGARPSARPRASTYASALLGFRNLKYLEIWFESTFGPIGTGVGS